MNAQNSNFAAEFFIVGVFSCKFCILDINFPTRRIFLTTQNLGGGEAGDVTGLVQSTGPYRFNKLLCFSCVECSTQRASSLLNSSGECESSAGRLC